MTEKAKSPVLILIILIVVSLALAGGGFFLFQREHAKNLALSDELEELKTRQKITESELEKYKKALSEMEVKLKDTLSRLDSLTNDLQNEKKAKLEAQSQIEKLKVELDQQKDLRSDLENKLTQAQKDVKDTQSRVRELESKKTDLETKVSELQAKSRDLETKMERVELGKIVVSPEAASKQKKAKPESAKLVKKKATPAAEVEAPASSQPEGKVLVINKDYNFVVINLGTKDGIATGDVFSVYRRNKYVGDIKVSKVHDTMSAADFMSEGIKDKISEGDKVVRKAG